MKKVIFFGLSDDTFGYKFEVDGQEKSGDDHDDCGRSSFRVYWVQIDYISLWVHGAYGPFAANGVYGWAMGVSYDPEDGMPECSIEIQHDPDRKNPRLVISTASENKIRVRMSKPDEMPRIDDTV